MGNIDEFIAEWQGSSDEVYSEHIDFFINKLTYNYEDCIAIMKEVRTKLNYRALNDSKLMIRIQCGHSKKIQDWGQQFWQLVDASLTPPELFIGKGDSFKSCVSSRQIDYSKQIENIENYVVFYPVEGGFVRCLDLIEKEVPDV